MSIDSVSRSPVPQAACPYDVCGGISPTGAPVAVRTTVDFDCPRYSAPLCFINLSDGQNVPNPKEDDPELFHRGQEIRFPPGQRLLDEDVDPGPGPAVAISSEIKRRLGCIPGQRGCRG